MGKLKELLFKDIHSKRAWTTGLIVLFGTLFAVALCLINVYLLDKPFYPYGTVFSPWPDTFGDLMFTLNVVLGNMQPYQYLGHNYFPFTYVLLYPLRMFPAQTGALLCLLIFASFMFAYVKQSLKKIPGSFWLMFIFTLFCYPVLFVAERANIEMFIFMFLAGFVWAYNKKYFYAAAAFTALAISLKLYPAVFLVLFAKDKLFKQISFALALSIILFYISMLLTGNNMHGLITNLAYFNDRYALGPWGVSASHNLYSLLRLPLNVMLNYNSMSMETYRGIVSCFSLPHLIFSFVFFAAASLIVMFKEKSFWKNLFILTACSVWLPYVSFDYTLLDLLIPFFLFIWAKEPSSAKEDLFYCVGFAVLFIPLNWYWMCVSEFWRINIGVPIKAITLGGMLVFVMFKDFSLPSLYDGFKQYAADVLPVSKKLFK